MPLRLKTVSLKAWQRGRRARGKTVEIRQAAHRGQRLSLGVWWLSAPPGVVQPMSSTPFLPPLSAAAKSSGTGWYWIVPRVAVGLFLLTIAALVWWLHSNDLEEQRATLINDVLWMEQDLRFHLDRNAEQMAQIGRDASDRRLDPQVIEARLRSLIANGHGLLALFA